MKKGKTVLLKLINFTPRTKDWAARFYRIIKKCHYQIKKRGIVVDDHMVVFESFLGKQYGCSPKALFLAMAENPAYREYKKIWMFQEPERYRFLEKYDNTKVVKCGSKEYSACYARAKYWITNYHLPAGVVKGKNQIYVQTWHGTPLKKIGCDVGEEKTLSQDKKRAWKEYSHEGTIIDYMPSPSPFYTEKIKSAFRLKDQAKILEYGYPRNDFLMQVEESFCREMKKKLEIPEGKKVMLYAPTWRDNQHVPGQGYVYESGMDFDLMRQEFGKEWVILFRAHYLISNSFDFEKYQGFVVDASRYDDVNHLYAISDLLITDYSSVFFDYANLNRPILFYMYDYEEYRKEMRDFYFELSELPGPVMKRQEELVAVLKKLSEEGFTLGEAYIKFNKKYNPYQEPCSGRMISEIIKAGCEK